MRAGPRKRQGGAVISELQLAFLLNPSYQMWTEMPKGKSKKPVNKDRFISKMFLR